MLKNINVKVFIALFSTIKTFSSQNAKGISITDTQFCIVYFKVKITLK